MEFARKVWKLLVAVKDGLVLILLLLFFSAIYAALSTRPGKAAVQDGALLLDLNGVVVEEPSAIDPLNLLLSTEAPVSEYRARDIVRALRGAARDDRIKSVVLDLSGFMGGGFVHMQDIGHALEEVRGAGKTVYAFSRGYLDDGILLAAHADEVWMDPNGGAFITGPGGSRLYFAGLLDKLNVNVNVFRVGTYKSAVEPYILNGPSDASKEAEAALQGAIWEEWKADYTKARPKVDLDQVTNDPAAWLNQADGNPAQAALAAGLIDRIGTKSEFDERMVEAAGRDRFDDGFGKYAHTGLRAWLSAIPQDSSGGAIGVVTIAGEIVDGDAGPGVAGSERIVGLLEDALDEDIRALVVRVDSPGGAIMGSEHIRRAIQRFRDRKIPVVVSMGNVAASGGYWVSTPANRIFAEPGTITGSIGVFAIIPTFEKALGSLGVTGGGVKTTPLTGQPDLMGGLSPQVAEMFQSSVDNNYRQFVSLVGKSRNISPESAENWAEGRPWAGGTARQLRLIDEFGGLDEALAYAAKSAGLADGGWHAEFLGEGDSDTLSEAIRLLGGGDSEQAMFNGDFMAMAAARQDIMVAQLGQMAHHLMGSRGVQAYCLECATFRPALTQRERTGAMDVFLAGLFGIRNSWLFVRADSRLVDVGRDSGRLVGERNWAGFRRRNGGFGRGLRVNSIWVGLCSHVWSLACSKGHLGSLTA